jgi:hypothetical protein
VNETKAIRLRYSLRTGKEILPPGAVVDADPAVADELLEKQLADETDTFERYPNHPHLTIVHECPVAGSGPTPARVVYAGGYDAPLDAYGYKRDTDNPTPPRVEEAAPGTPVPSIVGAAPFVPPGPAPAPEPEPKRGLFSAPAEKPEKK